MAMAALMLTAAPLHAQSIIIVNGDPISELDIAQRSKLIQISDRKTPSRSEVVEELINEKLKIQLIRRFTIQGIDKEVDNSLAIMASRIHATPRQLAELLAKQGVGINTLRSRLAADLTWSHFIRGRYQSQFQFNDKDVDVRLATKDVPQARTVGHEYKIRPILFVIPPGSSPTVLQARVKEAQTLRARFENCDTGLDLARDLRDVVIRPLVVKASADLPDPVRQMLESTELGHLTPPAPTEQGLELYAICGKSQSSNAPIKNEIRQEMSNEVFQSLSKKTLKELREKALIEYR
jgi:peptidyl-prolyl cis-trans isomerase SurA